MSRIILSKYDNGDDHVVVGWDRAQQTYYWQEFAAEPRMFYSEERGKWMVDDRAYDTKVEAQDHQWDGWEEMLGFGGYNDGELPEIADLYDHAMMFGNDPVTNVLADFADQGSLLALLREHKGLPSPASNIIIDLSTREDS
jgi:hypothetical protein